MHYVYDENGNVIRNRVTVDCSGDEPLTEQSHKAEVDINEIIRRHDSTVLASTAALMANELRFDDVTGNDFQEAMFKVAKGNEAFMELPSELRKKFDNSPAMFMDFVQNPANLEQMYEMGLAIRPLVEEPVRVIMETQNVPVAPTEQLPGNSAPETPAGDQQV